MRIKQIAFRIGIGLMMCTMLLSCTAVDKAVIGIGEKEVELGVFKEEVVKAFVDMYKATDLSGAVNGASEIVKYFTDEDTAIQCLGEVRFYDNIPTTEVKVNTIDVTYTHSDNTYNGKEKILVECEISYDIYKRSLEVVFTLGEKGIESSNTKLGEIKAK